MNVTLAELKTAPEAVSVWLQHPSLYEINTWVWLADLSQKYRRTINLSFVPSLEWDAIAAFGFHAVWVMGVWERSPAGIAIANQNQGLLKDFWRALPDFRPDDNVESPYCMRRYVVDDFLGGPEGLSVARRELSKRGMNLVLDFVPNHVAPDQPWWSPSIRNTLSTAVTTLGRPPPIWSWAEPSSRADEILTFLPGQMFGN
jgi:hypothetical protein